MIFNPSGKLDRLMTNAETIHRYIHAGKGKVTLVAPSMNAHEYWFRRPANPNEFEPGTIFVSVIHEGRPMYIGILDQGDVRLTRSSKFNPDTEAVKGAKYIAAMSINQGLVDRTPMKLYHSGKCCKCGRKLTDSKSMLDGIGRKCLKKYNALVAKEPWDGNS